LRQIRASNFDLPIALGLQPADRAFKIILNKSGVGPTDFIERETTHFGWFRHAASRLFVEAANPVCCGARTISANWLFRDVDGIGPVRAPSTRGSLNLEGTHGLR
jgi:hypothetical protein